MTPHGTGSIEMRKTAHIYNKEPEFADLGRRPEGSPFVGMGEDEWMVGRSYFVNGFRKARGKEMRRMPLARAARFEPSKFLEKAGDRGEGLRDRGWSGAGRAFPKKLYCPLTTFGFYFPS